MLLQTGLAFNKQETGGLVAHEVVWIVRQHFALFGQVRAGGNAIKLNDIRGGSSND